MKTTDRISKIQILALTVIFLICSNVSSQSHAKLLPVEDLISDTELLIRNLKESHPFLSRPEPDKRIVKELDLIIPELRSDLSLEDYFQTLAPVIAEFNCSHTGIRLPEQYIKVAQEHGSYFPLELFFRNERAFYISDFSKSDPGVSPGTEILSINKIPVSKIINQIISMIPAEKSCTTTKYNEINENFHSYYYLLDNSQSFNVVFDSDELKSPTEFAACAYEKVHQFNRSENQEVPVNQIINKENDLCILKVPSFGIWDMEGYMQQLENVFIGLRVSSISNLIVDLRDNGGGHPIFAAQLLSYLVSEEFTYFTRNPVIPDFEPLYNPMEPNGNFFHGKLFVLVNGGCLSTTGHLISLIKFHTTAKFIGEEPGSTYTCNDFSKQIVLPNTGIMVNIPQTTFETAISEEAKGSPFTIDYPVRSSIKEIVSGTDSYLSFAFKVINEQKSKP